MWKSDPFENFKEDEMAEILELRNWTETTVVDGGGEADTGSS